MERLSAINRLVMQFLYPEHCLGCDVPDVWVCASCLANVPVFDAPRQAPPLPSGRLPLVSAVFAVSAYAEPLWHKMIRALKYERLEEILPQFREVFDRYRTRITPHWPFGMGEGWALVPIPTNPEHVEDRGGDHMDAWFALVSALLPEARDGRGGLLRRGGGVAQASFATKGAREQAMQQGYFAAKLPAPRILFIDDVYTTGATMQAAAEAFKRAGAMEVGCFVGAFSVASEQWRS